MKLNFMLAGVVVIAGLQTFSRQAFADPFPACSPLTESVRANLDSNTFMYIPMNTYAAVYTHAKAQEYIAKNCQNTHLPMSEILNCRSLQECNSDDCRAPFLSSGTAFLVGDGKTLYTAWHVAAQTSEAAIIMVGGFLEHSNEMVRKAAYSKLKPEFVLVDQKDQIVYDTRQDHNTAYVSMGDPIKVMYAMGHLTPKDFGAFESSPSDFVGIQLSRSVGAGLPIAANQPVSSDCVYSKSFFFDGKTSSETQVSGNAMDGMKSFLKQNPKNYDFMIQPLPMERSHFENRSVSVVLTDMMYSPASVKKQLREFSNKILRTSIAIELNTQAINLEDIKIYDSSTTLLTSQPIISGGSGSPMVNSLGEVVAIATNALMDFDAKGSPIDSHGAVGVLIEPALKRAIWFKPSF